MNDLRHLPYIFVSQASKRFPDDFMFQLTSKDLANWRSQNVMSSAGKMGLRYPPFAFTELGVAMLSSVLSSDKAVDVNISIMRAFELLRQHLSDYNNLKKQISKLEKEMNVKFKDIHQALNHLLYRLIYRPLPKADLYHRTTPKTKPQSFLYLSSRNQYDAKGTPSLFFIDRYYCSWAVKVHDQNRQHVL